MVTRIENIGAVHKQKRPFSPEQDAKLAQLWFTPMTIVQIAEAVGHRYTLTRNHAIFDLGLPGRGSNNKAKPRPTEEIWIEAATYHARSDRLKPAYVLGGRTYQRCVRARWRAWRDVLASNPKFSVLGLAQVSGFDHSTILNGLRKLQQIEGGC
jgi:hypothetical protein